MTMSSTSAIGNGEELVTVLDQEVVDDQTADEWRADPFPR